MHDKKNNTRIEIWGDMVAINDLTKAIVLSAVTTMGGYFIAPSDNISLQLFFGLGGALIGFLLTAFWIEPKRLITLDDQNLTQNNTEEENQ